MNLYFNNSEQEIKKLKEDLMTSSTKSEISNQSLKEYKQLKNDDLGLIFEENIRNSLSVELGWKEENREFSYRKIEKFNLFEPHFIKTNEKKSLFFDSREFICQHNDDTSFFCYDKEKMAKIDKNKEGVIRVENSFPIIVSPPIKIEMDGFYCIDFFDALLFDTKEVKIIYKNVSDDELSSFNYVVLESKLSMDKVKDIINQLIEDKRKLEEINYTNKNILYIGMVNFDAKKNIPNIYVPKKDNIKIIVFGICQTFFGRNMLKPLEWKDIKELKELKKDIKGLKNDIKELKESQNEAKKKSDEIDKKLQQILTLLNIPKTVSNEDKKSTK